jgi:AraC-like DNA-binding protein
LMTQDALKWVNQGLNLVRLESEALQPHYVQGDVLSNAIKLIPPGGKVTISFEMMSGPKKQILVRVSDTGVGISQDALPHIFDRFYQSPNMEQALTGVTGFGLALILELVVAIKGAISVKGKPGKETTLEVLMSVSNNSELQPYLKNDLHTYQIPIVLLSAKDHDGHLNQQELLLRLSNLPKLQRRHQNRLARQMASSHQHDISIEETVIQQLRDIVLEHLPDSNFGVPELCRCAAMSRPQLHRKLTVQTHQNPSHFIRSIRLGYARTLLLSHKMSVQEAALETGFDDPKYFSRAFTKEFGVPPSRV